MNVIFTAGLPPACIDFLMRIKSIKEEWDEETGKKTWAFRFHVGKGFTVDGFKFHSPLALRSASMQATGRPGFPHAVSTKRYWDRFVKCLFEIKTASESGEDWKVVK